VVGKRAGEHLEKADCKERCDENRQRSSRPEREILVNKDGGKPN